MASASDDWSRATAWVGRIRLLDRTAVVLSLLAGVTQAFVHFFAGTGGIEYLAITFAIAGVLVARWCGWVGLGLTLGAVVLVAATAQPVAEWSIVVFTLFSVTVRGLPAVWAGGLSALVLYVALAYADGVGPFDPIASVAFATAAASAATASAVRSHQKYLESIEARTRDALATRELEANRRVAEERLRIARDLHDVVGHEIATISMHLGVAEVSLPPGPGATREALESARTGVQSVLRETQRILQLLRSDDDADDAPDVRSIRDLLDSFRQIGLTVTIDGTPPDIPDPEVGQAAYRLVQESLTNAYKHGDGDVGLRFGSTAEAFEITVTNRAPTGSNDGVAPGGFGLIGMHERATAVGGQVMVDAGDGEFRVTIALPNPSGAGR